MDNTDKIEYVQSKYVLMNLTKNDVQVSIPSKNNQMTYYANSVNGRKWLTDEIDDETITSQIMAQWGDSPTVFPQPLPQPDIETVRAAKLAELDAECSAAITAGKNIETSHGLRLFTFSVIDQNNIKDAMDTIRDVENGIMPKEVIAGGIPFKASDGDCLYYTKADIIKIDTTKKAWILYNRTYLAALLAWCGTMTEADEIIAAKYSGKEALPAEYQAHIDAVMTPINTLLSFLNGGGDSA